ncbi:hypothetical protein K431DRAFT_41940 [Polychaeton citri CBS 116435]|uniref:Uncharacterized protein n=1 Tax=Polychaeton citri CBS 116435 TaxID=1314669 RepID=A0A9P4URH9_9PEZI|nr:hypothetical protein K431DRAFT_41940 [Polychaeton citri CBS 116435]
MHGRKKRQTRVCAVRAVRGNRQSIKATTVTPPSQPKQVAALLPVSALCSSGGPPPPTSGREQFWPPAGGWWMQWTLSPSLMLASKARLLCVPRLAGLSRAREPSRVARTAWGHDQARQARKTEGGWKSSGEMLASRATPQSSLTRAGDDAVHALEHSMTVAWTQVMVISSFAIGQEAVACG